ncbi:MAG: ligase-associated DNA damage response exonuclease [Lewinellaceae bacterium]|nr:ligase-associated DNA damage response exonuclease [Saprospiraceae bacterium]MCB9341088.1 ligase-associated DNA damage response exonuclease [Lewinellaceae bacterium]
MLQFNENGIYCPDGNFYIDPWKPVGRAITTHAHSDHARPGSKHYLAHRDSSAVMRLRLGADISLQTLGYGEPLAINGVKVSLYPAGHIPGSAQVRVEKGGEVWVVSGDYKIQPDGVCEPFEPVPCHTFITESTFGLPVYHWQPQSLVFQDINNWWRQNQSAGKVSVLCGYSLGKAQRIVKNIDLGIGRVFSHGAIFNVNETLREAGLDLPFLPKVTDGFSKKDFEGALIVAPPSVGGTTWLKRFGPHSLAVCSGWMQVRGNARRRNVDRGFVLSDHADWDGLLYAVKATAAEKVFVTHGFTSIFSRYLNETGIQAAEVKTEFGTEEEDTPNTEKAA